MKNGMTLASKLKQKANSVNSIRLSFTAKTKREKIEKAARQAEIEIARKVRAKVQEKKRKTEESHLIKWLTSGLILAWDGQDRIHYKPTSIEERNTAKKYLGYSDNQQIIWRLNEAFLRLEICSRNLQIQIQNFKGYVEISAPACEFNAEILLSSYKEKTLLFSSFWKVAFARELSKFEKSANKSYLAKLKEESRIAKSELERVKKEIKKIPFDIDLMHVTRLADELRPRIKAFHKLYNSLVISPESFFRARPDVHEFTGVNYVDLIRSREYQYAVARHVLNEMNIHSFVSYPDVIGKSMAAFRLASGENLFDALLNHITDKDLLKKFEEFRQLVNLDINQKNKISKRSLDGKKVDFLVHSLFRSAEKMAIVFNQIDVANLRVINNQFGYEPSLKIVDLFATNIHPKVDRLAYDIQWLSSSAGKKFKRDFIKYLDELAEAGRLKAKFKVFSIYDGLQIEIPSRKKIWCDIDWYSFEKILKFLDFEITETTSTGFVKIKWG
jgi:hypothetical protein